MTPWDIALILGILFLLALGLVGAIRGLSRSFNSACEDLVAELQGIRSELEDIKPSRTKVARSQLHTSRCKCPESSIAPVIPLAHITKISISGTKVYVCTPGAVHELEYNNYDDLIVEYKELAQALETYWQEQRPGATATV